LTTLQYFGIPRVVFAPALHSPMLGLVSAGHSIRVAFVLGGLMNTMEMLPGKGSKKKVASIQS